MRGSDVQMDCKVHTLQVSHVREFRRSIADPLKPLRICIKQYTPRTSRTPQPGDVTIISAAGLGFVKELYEPLFLDLIAACATRHIHIRSIWIADTASQGESAQLNIANAGNREHMWDHSRDLLHMINTFQSAMPAPIVGVAHSIGAAQLVTLSHFHPRLFSALVLIEPTIDDKQRFPGSMNHIRAAQMRNMIAREDHFDSLEEARTRLLNSKSYATWDPRCRERLAKHHLIAASSAADEKAGVPATSKAAELGLMMLPNLANVGKEGLQNMTPDERYTIPNFEPDTEPRYPLYSRFELKEVWLHLYGLRPPALFLLGSKSPVQAREMAEARIRDTGTSVGGSGGVQHGMVKQSWIHGGTHTVPFEKPAEVAAEASAFLETMLLKWRREEERFFTEWGRLPAEKKRAVDPEHVEAILAWRPEAPKRGAAGGGGDAAKL